MGLKYITRPEDSCTLRDFIHDAMAVWNVGHKDGLYSLLSVDQKTAVGLGRRIEQTLRIMRAPVCAPPQMHSMSSEGGTIPVLTPPTTSGPTSPYQPRHIQHEPFHLEAMDSCSSVPSTIPTYSTHVEYHSNKRISMHDVVAAHNK